jgi:hypothetical protein
LGYIACWRIIHRYFNLVGRHQKRWKGKSLVKSQTCGLGEWLYMVGYLDTIILYDYLHSPCPEVETRAELPFKGWNNQKVWVEVTSGYRLTCPQDCPEGLYAIMQQCWEPNTTDRPTFEEIISKMETVLANDGIKVPPAQKGQDHQSLRYEASHNMKSVNHPNMYLQSVTTAYEQPETATAYEQPVEAMTSSAGDYEYSNPGSRAPNMDDPAYAPTGTFNGSYPMASLVDTMYEEAIDTAAMEDEVSRAVLHSSGARRQGKICSTAFLLPASIHD